MAAVSENMNRLYKLRCFGYAEIGNDIWFSNLEFNALIKLNKLTGQIDIIDKFPHYDIWQVQLYSKVCYADGYLIFIPADSEEIVSYHIKTKKFISTPLDKDLIEQKKPYYMNAYVFEHYVYMFPTGAACILRYDFRKHKVKYLDNSLSRLIRSSSEKHYYFYQQFEVLNGKVYFPFLELNAVAVFDAEDETLDIRYLDIEGGCSTINYVEGSFYLASWKKPVIYQWDVETDKIKTYSGFPESFIGEQTFLCAYKMQDILLFFPESSNMILSLSLKNGEIKEIEKVSNHDNERVRTYFVENDKGQFCMMTADRKHINIFNYKEGIGGEIRPYCQMDDLYNNRQISNFLLSQDYYNNILEWGRSLEEFIEVLAGCEEANVEKKSSHYGKRIYEWGKC